MSNPELWIVLFFLSFVVLWIWALVDAIRVPDDSMYRTGNKLVWVLVIVVTGIIGAIIYLAIGRPGGPRRRGARGRRSHLRRHTRAEPARRAQPGAPSPTLGRSRPGRRMYAKLRT